MFQAVDQTANALMVAVARTGCVRQGNEADLDVAVKVMREELKAFLTDDKYASERAVTLTGGQSLAMASLVVNCTSRILAERS
jgi:hypothetical protein